MRILVSNDDGFHAEGIQVLAKELRKIADVVIVAPDRPAGRTPPAGILCCGGGHPAYRWGRRANSSCGSLQSKSRPR